MSTNKEKNIITVNKKEFVKELMKNKKNNKFQINAVPKPRKRISDLNDYFAILDGKIIALRFTNSNFDREFIQQLKEILGLDPIDISKIKIAKAKKEKELKINDGV